MLRQVGRHVDAAETAVGIAVGHATFGQQGLDFFLGFQPVHQLLLQGELGQVTTGCRDAFRHGVDTGRKLFRGQLAQLGDVFQVAAPDVVHPVQVRFLRFGRSRIKDVGFGGGLEFAHAEQVYIHAQLFLQATTVVLAVTPQSFQHHAAHRVDVDLVGLRGQQVLRLAEVFAECHDLLAGGTQLGQRRRHFAHRGITAGLQAIHAQQHALDVLVFAGGVDGAHQIAQLHFLATLVAQCLGQRARDWVGTELLHQPAFRRDHQRGALGQRLHPASTTHGHQEQHQEQEQQAEEKEVQDQPAGEIHHVPQTDKESGNGTATDNLIHGGRSR